VWGRVWSGPGYHGPITQVGASTRRHEDPFIGLQREVKVELGRYGRYSKGQMPDPGYRASSPAVSAEAVTASGSGWLPAEQSETPKSRRRVAKTRGIRCESRGAGAGGPNTERGVTRLMGEPESSLQLKLASPGGLSLTVKPRASVSKDGAVTQRTAMTERGQLRTTWARRASQDLRDARWKVIAGPRGADVASAS